MINKKAAGNECESADATRSGSEEGLVKAPFVKKRRKHAIARGREKRTSKEKVMCLVCVITLC
jgi:hypothetical protein